MFKIYNFLFCKFYIEVLPEETSIHTAEMKAIEITLKDIHKRNDKVG